MPESRKEAALPLLLMAGTSLPFAQEIAANTERRYDKVLKDLREAPYRQPGERVVTADAKSFVEKRAALQQEKTAAGAGGFFGALSSLGGAAIKHPLAAAGIGAGVMGAGALLGPALDAWGEKIKDNLVPSNMRDTMVDEGSKGFAKGLGTQAGKSVSEMFSEMLTKVVSGIQSIPQGLTRSNMFEQLQQEDDVLAQADPQQLQEAYHTMVRFAPTLATDKNAVRSFLRESVLYGSGPNVVTIKQLADAERASTGE